MDDQQPAVEVVTTTASFDKETYRVLQHLAVDADASVRDLIREAVSEYVARRTSGKKGGRS
jgi:predicted transcriptional regulator